MKNSKLLISCISFVIVLLMSSCLDSNGGGNSKQTFYSYATVADQGRTLIADDGVTLLPSANTLSQLGNIVKAERVYVGYTLQDGQVVSNNVKTYSVDLIGFAPIRVEPVKLINDLNIAANDSLKDPKFNVAVNDFGFIATNKYITVQSKYNLVNQKVPYMSLWSDERIIKKDTLFLNLYFNDRRASGEMPGYNLGSNVASFKTNDLRSLFPTKDSVVVAVSGMVNNDQYINKIIKRTLKVALR